MVRYGLHSISCVFSEMKIVTEEKNGQTKKKSFVIRVHIFNVFFATFANV